MAGLVETDFIGTDFFFQDVSRVAAQQPTVDLDLALGAGEQHPVGAAVVHDDPVGVAIGELLEFFSIRSMDLHRPALIHSEPPLGDVEVMGAPVGHAAAGVGFVVSPGGVVAVDALGAEGFVVAAQGGRPQPRVPVGILRRWLFRKIAIL